MFIKRTTRRVGATTYVNHLLVESVATPQGSRHRSICSLGSLAPAPAEQWRSLAHKLAAALGGQRTLVPEPAVEALAARARPLTEIMTLNRLVGPASEHAMPDWIRRTALGDILGTDFTPLADDALYRNLDRLHPQRAQIEQALAARERTLFTLEDT